MRESRATFVGVCIFRVDLESATKAGRGPKSLRIPSTADIYLVGGHGALLVPHGLDFSDGKPAISKLGLGLLQSGMQVILQCRSLLRRRQQARVDAVYLAGAAVRIHEELHVFRCGGG